MLEGLDAIAWDELGHAYGSADDVPETLRRLTTGDDQALWALFGNIWHQGTVYSSTSHAVPFLIEILDAAPAPRAGILNLLAAIADGASYHAVHDGRPSSPKAHLPEMQERIALELTWVTRARAAVEAGVPAYLRMLMHPVEEVRGAAAHVLGWCKSRKREIEPAFADRLARDERELVRTSVVLAAMRLELAELVTIALDDRASGPRVAAALATARREPPASERVLRILTHEAPNAFTLFRGLPWDRLEPSHLILSELGDRWALQVELLSAWLRASDPEVRSDAVRACESVMHHSRLATPRLVPELVRALDDPERDVRSHSASLLASGGRAAAAATDALFALCDREPLTNDGPAVHAFIGLCRHRDPRAAERVRRALASFDGAKLPPVLDLALPHLGPWAGCLDPLIAALPSLPPGSPRVRAIVAIGRHAASAAPAVETLTRELRRHPQASAHVLGRIGPDARSALPDLERLLEEGEPFLRLNAVRSIWQIGGDAERVLPLLCALIDDPRTRTHALDVVPTLGDRAAELAPRLAPLIDDADPDVSARAAIAYFHATSDAPRVLPTLLANVRCSPLGLEVVTCLGEVGPLAHEAIPLLRDAIESPWRQVEVGDTDTWIETDEAWAERCAAALTRIAPS